MGCVGVRYSSCWTPRGPTSSFSDRSCWTDCSKKVGHARNADAECWSCALAEPPRNQHASLNTLNKNGQHKIAAYGRIGLFGLTEEWFSHEVHERWSSSAQAYDRIPCFVSGGQNLKTDSQALFAISSDSPEPRLEKGENDLKSSS